MTLDIVYWLLQSLNARRPSLRVEVTQSGSQSSTAVTSFQLAVDSVLYHYVLSHTFKDKAYFIRYLLTLTMT